MAPGPCLVERGDGGVRFAQNRPVKIVMLGAGGTGGHIAPHLYRLLYALGQRECRFLIVDGDLVEKKNLVRQNFIEADLGKTRLRSWRSGIPPSLAWKPNTSPRISKARRN